MPEVSKQLDSNIEEETVDEVANTLVTETTANENNNDEFDDDEPVESTNADAVPINPSAKKKKSKKAKLKKAFGVSGSEDGNAEGSSGSANPASKLTTGMVEQLLEMNPSLKSEVAGMNKEKAAQTLKKLDVADLLTGMVTIAMLQPWR